MTGDSRTVLIVGSIVGLIAGGTALYFILKKNGAPPGNGDYVQYLREHYRDDLLRRAATDPRFVGAAEEFMALTAGITEYVPNEIHGIYLEIYYRYAGGGG